MLLMSVLKKGQAPKEYEISVSKILKSNNKTKVKGNGLLPKYWKKKVLIRDAKWDKIPINFDFFIFRRPK